MGDRTGTESHPTPRCLPGRTLDAMTPVDASVGAYTSDESGRYEISSSPFSGASRGRWVVSQVGGVEPQWSRDGRELFFSGQTLMVVIIRQNGGSFSASKPRELLSALCRLVLATTAIAGNCPRRKTVSDHCSIARRVERLPGCKRQLGNAFEAVTT